jgi:hypothetical protein
MKEEFDLPFINSGVKIINEYVHLLLESEEGRSRTENDEQVMINMLTGLGGLIEYNVRSGYQHFARKHKLSKDNFFNFSDLIDALGKYIQLDSHKRLLKVSSQIRNKLMHADFTALYKKTEEAYKIPDTDFHYPLFEPLVVTIQTKITRYGLHLDAKTGKASNSRGEPIPSTKLLPGAGNSITMDFTYFYDSGHFVHVYDVLMSAYRSVLPLRYSFS